MIRKFLASDAGATFVRGLNLNYLLLFLAFSPILAPVLAVGVDRTATVVMGTVSGPGVAMGQLTAPCVTEDGTSERYPCFWDAATRGNRNVGALRRDLGLTGYVLYPGTFGDDGDPVACFEGTNMIIYCEDGVEWNR